MFVASVPTLGRIPTATSAPTQAAPGSLLRENLEWSEAVSRTMPYTCVEPGLHH